MDQALAGSQQWRSQSVTRLLGGPGRLLKRSNPETDADDWVLRRVPAGAEVLFLGPASPELVGRLAARGSAVDIAGVCHAQAKSLRSRCRKVVTGTHLAEAWLERIAGSRAWVVATGLVAEAEDPALQLATAALLLRPGGSILLSLPAERLRRSQADLFIAAGLRVRRAEWTSPLLSGRAVRLAGLLVGAAPRLLGGHGNFELAPSRVIIPGPRHGG